MVVAVLVIVSVIIHQSEPAFCLDLFLMSREAQKEGYQTGAVLVVTARIALDVPGMPSDVECARFDALADAEILGCREAVDLPQVRPNDRLADGARGSARRCSR